MHVQILFDLEYKMHRRSFTDKRACCIMYKFEAMQFRATTEISSKRQQQVSGIVALIHW